jgi:GT2 family glycosyltransferase
MRPPLPCPFRDPVWEDADGERAVCRLLQDITGLSSATGCAVSRDACEACCALPAPSPVELNPVFAAVLYELAGQVREQGGAAGCDPAAAADLQQWAEEHLDFADAGSHLIWVDGIPAVCNADPPRCDVVLCCVDASAETDRAVRSVLDQEGAVPVLHLVDDGGGAAELVHRYRNQRGVISHLSPFRRGPLATLHDLVPQLESEYVAIQDPATVSRPGRLRACVGWLVEHGADLLAAGLETPAGVVFPEAPNGGYRRFVPAPTLVFRRAALIDLGGTAERTAGADAELVYRAHQERRRIVLAREVTVSCGRVLPAEEPGPAPRYVPREGSLRHHGRGFPEGMVACDVVLPFHGHLDYVRQALEGLLAQEGADVVIHLVDDASPEDTEAFLRSWRGNRRVRTYRNTRNLGQFASFNNIFAFRETDLLAVQDADDVSLPGRLHRAGNALRLADADIFGGRTWVFDDGWAQRAGGSVLLGRKTARLTPNYRTSRYPGREKGYFLENPTAMFRASTFERLGGFADFGSLHRNRCGVDTEFYLRACYSGVRFALSQDVVLCYRSHQESATQHPLTRWGSPARNWSERECLRRHARFRRGPFDPQAFGSLRRHWGGTRRV